MLQTLCSTNLNELIRAAVVLAHAPIPKPTLIWGCLSHILPHWTPRFLNTSTLASCFGSNLWLLEKTLAHSRPPAFEITKHLHLPTFQQCWFSCCWVWSSLGPLSKASRLFTAWPQGICVCCCLTWKPTLWHVSGVGVAHLRYSNRDGCEKTKNVRSSHDCSKA